MHAAPPPPPIVRNLTSLFHKCRHERRAAKGVGRFGSESQGQLLLHGGDSRVPPSAETIVEMTALPPQWLEAAEEAREDIKAIREKLVQLTKAHKKRLLKVFSDDAVPDKEAEAIASQISSLVRSCEQKIHQVKSRGAGAGNSEKDQEFRQNFQRSLATQLQQISQQFRQTQKDHLNEIRKRQRGSAFEEVPASSQGGADVGFNEGQMLELEDMEVNASQRSEEVCRIASSINDLHTIFKELAVLVIDQGSILDRIDYNIEQVVVQSKEANVQLQKAEKSQKSNRAMKCIFLLVVIDLVLILILIVKARH